MNERTGMGRWPTVSHRVAPIGLVRSPASGAVSRHAQDPRSAPHRQHATAGVIQRLRSIIALHLLPFTSIKSVRLRRSLVMCSAELSDQAVRERHIRFPNHENVTGLAQGEAIGHTTLAARAPALHASCCILF